MLQPPGGAGGPAARRSKAQTYAFDVELNDGGSDAQWTDLEARIRALDLQCVWGAAKVVDGTFGGKRLSLTTECDKRTSEAAADAIESLAGVSDVGVHKIFDIKMKARPAEGGGASDGPAPARLSWRSRRRW